MRGEFLAWDDIGRNGGEVEKWYLGGGRGGNNGGGGNLVEDFGTCSRYVNEGG